MVFGIFSFRVEFIYTWQSLGFDSSNFFLTKLRCLLMSFTDSKPSYQEREEIEILLVFFSTDFALVDRMALFFLNESSSARFSLILRCGPQLSMTRVFFCYLLFTKSHKVMGPFAIVFFFCCCFFYDDDQVLERQNCSGENQPTTAAAGQRRKL